MLLVKEYLKTHTFKELSDEHGVDVSFSKSGNKFSLNYNQLSAKDTDELACQCRGLILMADDGRSFLNEAKTANKRLDYSNICPEETVIAAYPMDRFFNHGMGAAAKINFNDPSLKIMEKMDGTCIILYFNKFEDMWHVATRSCPEADIEIDTGFYTFRTLFEKALLETANLTFDQFTSTLDKNLTYVFELTSPYNQVVCKYKDTRITLLAARDKTTLQELDISILNIGIPCVHVHSFTCLNDILDYIASINPIDNEGVVCMDDKFNRVKMKSPAYLAYNKLHDSLKFSKRNLLQLILLEKEDDVLTFIPEEIANRIITMKQNLLKMIKYYDETYSNIREEADKISLNDRKQFALTIQKYNMWTAPIFEMYSGKAINMKDFLLKNKNILSKNGLTWKDCFLDKVLEIIENLSII